MQTTIIIPTRDEGQNAEALLRRLDTALTGHSADVLFVDDGHDDLPAVVAAAGEWGAHAIAVAQTARRAWRGWRAGRVVNQILELTPVPVMVARATGQRFA
jgi:nucleotide-binding universal stress UspA family protein